MSFYRVVIKGKKENRNTKTTKAENTQGGDR